MTNRKHDVIAVDLNDPLETDIAKGKLHVQGAASSLNDDHLKSKYQPRYNPNHLDWQDNQHKNIWQ